MGLPRVSASAQISATSTVKTSRGAFGALLDEDELKKQDRRMARKNERRSEKERLKAQNAELNEAPKDDGWITLERPDISAMNWADVESSDDEEYQPMNQVDDGYSSESSISSGSSSSSHSSEDEGDVDEASNVSVCGTDQPGRMSDVPESNGASKTGAEESAPPTQPAARQLTKKEKRDLKKKELAELDQFLAKLGTSDSQGKGEVVGGAVTSDVASDVNDAAFPITSSPTEDERGEVRGERGEGGGERGERGEGGEVRGEGGEVRGEGGEQTKTKRKKKKMNVNKVEEGDERGEGLDVMGERGGEKKRGEDLTKGGNGGDEVEREVDSNDLNETPANPDEFKAKLRAKMGAKAKAKSTKTAASAAQLEAKKRLEGKRTKKEKQYYDTQRNA